ncbi:claudin domain-containing protein 2-like [Ambystoma mexicanum]|uniref:claudin domain-containing protein 2-like n=1 Tax=Ambystoma mexicanum TaxID=8296 RepID=UPI0037E90070
MSCLQVTTLILVIVSTLFIIISLATDYWLEGPPFHLGLWKFCNSSDGCSSLPDLSFLQEKINATAPIVYVDCARGFTILTLVCLLIGVVAQALMIWFNSRLKVARKQKLTSSFVFLAVASEIIGMAIFRSFPGTENNTVALSWSYFLGWASVGFSSVAGLTTLYAFRK